MQLNNVEEVRSFMNIVDKCTGNVFLKSQHGDVYNLKSSLSEYIAIGRLIEEAGSELELYCDKTEDEEYFLEFFKNHPGSV